MDRKPNWKTSSRHSFDMSEYIYGERFVLGGVDFDLDDKPEKNQKEKKEKKDEKAKGPRTTAVQVDIF